eukprot:465862_1
MALWLLCLVSIFGILESHSCDSKQYAKNIEQKLRNKIGDKYNITAAGLHWFDNFTGWGNNPSGVYGAYIIPSSETTMNDGGGDTLLYAHDAIVFAGCTPPNAKYFSVIPYLFNRYNINQTNPKNITRYRSFRITASLGAALNHLLINTTNNNPFNALTTIIHTGDNVTYTHIYDVLYNESVNDINLQQIPSDYFNFAPYSINRYTFATYPLLFDSYDTLWRIEIPINMTQFYEYTKIIQPVFYLKYKNSNISNDVQPFQKYTNITCTIDIQSNSSNIVNETKIYGNDLIQYVYDLATNISIQYNYTIINITQMTPWGYAQNFGYQCIDNLKGCGSNNPDSVYYNHKQVNITDKDYYIIVGVNSFNNNLTVYQNVNYVIYPGRGGQGAHGGGHAYALPDGVLNNFQYNNSAIDLNIETNVSKSSIHNFYVLQYARPHSFIPNIMGFNISYKDVNVSTTISPNTRNYLHPLTKTKPNYLDLVSPLLITFRNE